MPGLQVAPSSDKTGYHHGGATELCQVFKWRHLPDKTGYHHSSHGGATERCQFFKWRHLPDKTGYHHHHHMVAPLSGARYSSGAIFRTKTGYHHHMVAPLSGARYSSGAIFRTKLVIIIITWWRRAQSDTQFQKKRDKRAEKRRIKDSSGAIFRTKLVIIIITWWRH